LALTIPSKSSLLCENSVFLTKTALSMIFSSMNCHLKPL
jgi:hypothetical protein